MQRELEIARREIAMFRQVQTSSIRDAQPRGITEERVSTPRSLQHSSLRMIAELVSEFDGTPDNFDVWEQQIKFMKNTHDLTDDAAKTLIGMKLKKKAFEWLHSKAEHLRMTFDDLIDELGRMYRPRRSKIEMRRKFEVRIWKREETFREYAHDKIVMGNRVPIETADMLDYLIDGIPDGSLRDQARIHCFATTQDLIDAFDKIVLRDQALTNSTNRRERQNPVSTKAMHGAKNINDKRYKTNKTNNSCFNCGESGHISTTCPAKGLGPKCYKCKQHGHISTKCTKDNQGTEEMCAVTQTPLKKYVKTVTIFDKDVEALIDTGSDLTLMCKDEHARIGSPPLKPTEIRFTGIGSPSHAALGEFTTEVTIDGNRFPILIRVVSDIISRQRLLIGTDFLEPRSFTAKRGIIYIEPDDEVNDDPLEVLQINVVDERDAREADLSHIEDKNTRQEIISLINDYEPQKAAETTVSMRIVLKDEEAVYQKPRRLAANEREFVNRQIQEWKSQGIVRPSSSDYASPVVLVKKKDGSYRLCIDYRMLNKKIVKDRYPLPLIEDQLDRLQ
ncbi:uncharacterized protein LOC144477862, partial [Augochlora pura]